MDRKRFAALLISSLLAAALVSCADNRNAPAPTEETATTTTAETTTEAPEAAKEFDEKALEVVKSSMKAVWEDGDAVAVINLMYPKAIVDRSYPTEDLICAAVFGCEKLPGGLKIEEVKVEKCVPLTASQLKDAEEYYEGYASVISQLADMDYTVLKGREITATAVLKGNDGDLRDYSSAYVVVDMGDEGYKIITGEASKIEKFAK